MAVTGLGRWLSPGWFRRSNRVNIGLIDGVNSPEFTDYLLGDFTPTFVATPIAPTTGNISHGETVNSTTLTWSHTVGSGTNVLEVAVAHEGSGTTTTVSSVTFGGASLTLAASQHFETTYDTRVEVWYLVSPTPSTANIVVTMGGIAEVDRYTIGLATDLKGVKAQAPQASDSATAASVTSILDTVTTTTDGSLVTSALSTNNFGDLADTHTSAQTRTDTLSNSDLAGGTLSKSALVKAGAGQAQMRWSVPGSFDRAVMVTLAWEPDTAFSGAYTLTAATASYSLTGTAVSLYEAKRMPANTASYALTGTAAITARGKAMPAATAAYALTGTAASVLEGKRLVGATASYALTGTASTLTYTPVGSYSLTAASASYSLTGSAVAFQRSRIMSAATASYALTGTAATLTKTTVGAFTLTATTAGYSLSGTAVALKDNRRLVAATASYALSGSAAGILRARVMAGATAAYSLTGTAAITKRGRSMAGASGSYALTGTADALKVGRRLVATTAGYSLAGAANSMSRGRTLVGASRSYALTGTSVAFKRTYKLGAESGAYVYSGSGVVLINSADSLIAYPIYGRTLSAAAITQGGPLIASPLAASTLTANPL